MSCDISFHFNSFLLVDSIQKMSKYHHLISIQKVFSKSQKFPDEGKISRQIIELRFAFFGLMDVSLSAFCFLLSDIGD